MLEHQKSDLVLEALKEISSKPQEIEEERLKKKMELAFHEKYINTSDEEAQPDKVQRRKSEKKTLNKSEEIREENISSILLKK